MRPGLLAGAALFALALTATVHADGEAGVVIDFGGGDVRSYCVAFQGDGIRGDDLLGAAGLSTNTFRAGGPSTLCSINGVGCQSSGTFDSCFCECQSGGSDCTYWSFFTRDYGTPAWRYSALAFDLTTAGDGDLHAWRWGQGSPNNAPAPAEMTFETVCGHPPQGGPAPAATNTSPPPTQPPPPATSAPPGPSPTGAVTGTPAATATRNVATSFPTSTPPPDASSTPAPPSSGDSDDDSSDDDDGGIGGLVAFAIAASVLIAGITGAAFWRMQQRGR